MTVGKSLVEASNEEAPWIVSPCVESAWLSAIAGCRIFLKLEHVQPSGSFKSRGVGNFVWRTVLAEQLKSKPRPLHFYACSGGNAGLAAVTAGKSLGKPVTVVVPSTTSKIMRDKISAAGGKVVVFGDVLSEADVYAKMLAKQDESGGVFVSPYDHELIWEGNATLVDELYTQLSGDAPTAIICSVGGGGLLNGIMLGLTHHSWATTAVLGVETHGSDSLAQSLRVGANTTIPTISSIARSLGVTRVSDMTWEFAKLDTFKSVVLSDAEAAMACVRFKEAEGVVIETACGVSVAACYAGVLKKCLKGFGPESRVVVICCGGSTVDEETLVEYEREYAGQVSW